MERGLPGPDTMLGTAHAMDGRIAEGLRHIEMSIARREKENYHIVADWYRLFLSEVYLETLSGQGEASLGVLLRNIRSLAGVFIFGEKRMSRFWNKRARTRSSIWTGITSVASR